MFCMKKILLFSLLALGFYSTWAQSNTGNNDGNNNSNQASPYFKNPYRDEVTPFVRDNNRNIFENDADDNKNNNSKNNPKNLTTEEKEKQILDFRDRNLTDKNKSPEELRERYKDDPEYLKYLGLDKESELKGFDKEDLNATVGIDPEEMLYGANFLTSGLNTGPNRITTVPNDYRLGIGDELVVSVWGASEYQNSFTIANDGSIFPNRIGKIFLQGLSFQSARDVIRSRFSAVLPPGSKVDIGLEKVRTIRVYVYGEVKRPGMITLSALNTPLNALQLVGGLNPLGNMRDIQIRRNGVVIERIDIYEYIKKGSTGREIYLEDNDYITVGLYEKIAQAKGAFKRPMRYQLKKYEGLNDLIDLAGGLSFDARKSLIRIKTIFNEKEQYIDIDGKNLLVEGDYILKDGDVVTTNPINKGVTNVVQIEGAVAYPDQYQIAEGEKLFDIIKKAGGLNSNAYKARAFVMRNGVSINDSRVLKFDLYEIDNDSSASNIYLENGDQIRILSENVFDKAFTIEVKGLVGNPGTIQYKPNLRLKDIILLAGGLQLSAENGRIEISNVTDTITRYSISGSLPSVQTVSISPNLEIDQLSENIQIKPFDIVYVRQKKDVVKQREVYLAGEVDYPGPYSILSEKERLSSIVKRSGGLKEQAYAEGAQLIRQEIGPIVINLKTALNNTGGAADLILEENDTIFVPKKMEIVSIRGNVQRQVNLKYMPSMQQVQDYVNNAGGFGHRPWRKKITVTYQNGTVKKTKSFLFFKFYPKVKPGSLIAVPVRPEPRKVDFASGFQYALGSLTSIVSVYLLLQNSK